MEKVIKSPEFKVTQYNTRRAQRGAIPLEILVTYDDGDYEYLWMTQHQVRKNIKEFGAHPELLKGMECYRQKRLVEFSECDQDRKGKG